jgi:hypothetical protein
MVDVEIRPTGRVKGHVCRGRSSVDSWRIRELFVIPAGLALNACPCIPYLQIKIVPRVIPQASNWKINLAF